LKELKIRYKVAVGRFQVDPTRTYIKMCTRPAQESSLLRRLHKWTYAWRSTSELCCHLPNFLHKLPFF